MNELRVVGVILARMGSMRFPNKIVSLIHGRTIIELIATRVRQCEVHEIPLVLATTEDASDDQLSAHAKNLGVDVFRGSSTDVLSRAVNAGKYLGGTHILRLNGDCPLVEPKLIDEALILLDLHRSEVISSKGQNGLPYGISVEIAELDLLDKLHHKAVDSEKEHIFDAVYSTKKFFDSGRVGSWFPARPDLRLTIDLPGDNLRIEKLIDSTGFDATVVKYWNIPVENSPRVE